MAQCSVKRRNNFTILPNNDAVSYTVVIVGFVMQLIWDCTKTINIFRSKSYHINVNLASGITTIKCSKW
jgi:hypothetical protein